MIRISLPATYDIHILERNGFCTFNAHCCMVRSIFKHAESEVLKHYGRTFSRCIVEICERGIVRTVADESNFGILRPSKLCRRWSRLKAEITVCQIDSYLITLINRANNALKTFRRVYISRPSY